MAQTRGGLAGADRGDVDDRAAAGRREQGAERAEHEEGAADVDAQGGIDGLDGHLLQGAAARDDAGVVHQHVESARGGESIGRRLHGGLVGDVEVHGRGAELVRDALHGFRVHVADEHLVPGPCERGGDASAEA